MSGRHGNKGKRRPTSDHGSPGPAPQIEAGERLAESRPADVSETVHNKLKHHVSWKSKPDPFDVALYTLIVTFAIAVIYSLQLSAMLDSNKANRDALESVQRAYVNFSTAVDTAIVIDPVTHKANSWNFTIPMENSGVTPTREMTAHVDRWYGHDKLPDDFAYPDTGDFAPQLIPLGPKAKTGLGPVGVTPDVIGALESVPFGGSYHLYFYGWAKYRDVFKGTPEHVTKFCYELTRVSGDPRTPKKEELYSYFSACQHHNCTDNECSAERSN